MDYIIKNGWIVNGKNEKPFYGDLAVKNGKIEEVGEHIEVPSDFSGKCVLDAAGGYVTPGFIDIHRHGDWQAFGNGDDELLNRQGLTTVVNGNCGLSVAPVGEKFREEIPRYMVKHQVRPGLTGWAQVNGYRGDTSIRKRIDYDLYYIENWTIGFDIKIMFLTIFKGFVNKNAY